MNGARQAVARLSLLPQIADVIVSPRVEEGDLGLDGALVLSVRVKERPRRGAEVDLALDYDAATGVGGGDGGMGRWRWTLGGCRSGCCQAVAGTLSRWHCVVGGSQRGRERPDHQRQRNFRELSEPTGMAFLFFASPAARADPGMWETRVPQSVIWENWCRTTWG